MKMKRSTFHLLGVVEVGMMGLADGVVMKCKKESTPGCWAAIAIIYLISILVSSICQNPDLCRVAVCPAKKLYFPAVLATEVGLKHSSGQ